MIITNSNLKDIPETFRLYKLVTDYQKIKFPENQWPEFDKASISKEIIENRQFKLLIEDKIACIWAITYNDPQILGEEDDHSAIYIHRIATNPNFRGNNFVKVIVDWAREFAKGKRYIRMDTCGNNEKLIQHYKKTGLISWA